MICACCFAFYWKANVQIFDGWWICLTPTDIFAFSPLPIKVRYVVFQFLRKQFSATRSTDLHLRRKWNMDLVEEYTDETEKRFYEFVRQHLVSFIFWLLEVRTELPSRILSSLLLKVVWSEEWQEGMGFTLFWSKRSNLEVSNKRLCFANFKKELVSS